MYGRQSLFSIKTFVYHNIRIVTEVTKWSTEGLMCCKGVRCSCACPNTMPWRHLCKHDAIDSALLCNITAVNNPLSLLHILFLRTYGMHSYLTMLGYSKISCSIPQKVTIIIHHILRNSGNGFELFCTYLLPNMILTSANSRIQKNQLNI